MVCLGGLDELQLLTDDWAQGPGGQPSDEGGVQAALLALRGIPQVDTNNRRIATHNGAGINGGGALIARATVAYDDHPTTPGQHIQVVAQIDVSEHFQNNIDATAVG